MCIPQILLLCTLRRERSQSRHRQTPESPAVFKDTISKFNRRGASRAKLSHGVAGRTAQSVQQSGGRD